MLYVKSRSMSMSRKTVDVDVNVNTSHIPNGNNISRKMQTSAQITSAEGIECVGYENTFLNEIFTCMSCPDSTCQEAAL